MSYFSKLQQDVTTPAGLQSTANIDAGATFTSESASTLGVAGIQVSLKTDENCTVYVDQSPDGSNWDINDDFNYRVSKGGGSWTVQAVASYVRVRVKNESGSATTYLRLQTALCPIIEAVPRALSEEGNLKVGVYEIEGDIGKRVLVTPMNALKVTESCRLVGATFTGSTLDQNFWTATAVGSGTATVGGGQLTLATGTTSASSETIRSVRIGRYVGGTSLIYRGTVQCPTSTGAVARTWGAMDQTSQNGYFFKLDSSAGLSIIARKGGVDTLEVVTGSFNGVLGATHTVDTNAHTYEIMWTNSTAYFFVDGDLLHTMSGASATLTETAHLGAYAQIANGANTNNNTLLVRVMTISRLGRLETQTMSVRINTLTTTVLKYGPGNLDRIVLGNVPTQAGTITIYDNTAASGTILAVLTPRSPANTFVPASIDMGNMPFATGLTIVTATNAVDMTVIFE